MKKKNLLLLGGGLAIAGLLIYNYRVKSNLPEPTNGQDQDENQQEEDLDFPIYPTEGCSYTTGSGMSNLGHPNWNCEFNNYVSSVQQFLNEEGLLDNIDGSAFPNQNYGYFDFRTSEILEEYLNEIKENNSSTYYALGYNDTENPVYITREFYNQMP